MKPTMNQIEEFFAQIKSERITKERLQGFLNEKLEPANKTVKEIVEKLLTVVPRLGKWSQQRLYILLFVLTNDHSFLKKAEDIISKEDLSHAYMAIVTGDEKLLPIVIKESHNCRVWNREIIQALCKFGKADLVRRNMKKNDFDEWYMLAAATGEEKDAIKAWKKIKFEREPQTGDYIGTHVQWMKCASLGFPKHIKYVLKYVDFLDLPGAYSESLLNMVTGMIKNGMLMEAEQCAAMIGKGKDLNLSGRQAICSAFSHRAIAYCRLFRVAKNEEHLQRAKDAIIEAGIEKGVDASIELFGVTDDIQHIENAFMYAEKELRKEEMDRAGNIFISIAEVLVRKVGK